MKDVITVCSECLEQLDHEQIEYREVSPETWFDPAEYAPHCPHCGAEDPVLIERKRAEALS